MVRRSSILLGELGDPPATLIRKPEPEKKPEEEKEEKMRLADIPDHIQGRKRLKDESDKDYRDRQKQEKKLMKLRLRHGVSYARPTSQIINTEKKILKQQRALKKDNRKRMAKAKKST